MSKKTKNKEKKIYFSEEIDSRINGFALTLTFVICGLILQFYPTYFGNTIVTEIVKWIFIVIGLLGAITEILKSKNKILGLDNFVLGLLFFGGWLSLFVFVKHWIANTLSFVLLIFGLYAIFLGFQQIGYSVSDILLKKKKGEFVEKPKGDFLLFLTKILGVILVVIQIVKAVIDLTN